MSLRFVALVFVLLLFTSPLEGQCVKTSRSFADPSVDFVHLTFQNLPQDTNKASAIRNRFMKGAGQWNDSNCNPGGTSFPFFTLSSPTSTYRNIFVKYNAGFGANEYSCGRFSGSTIDIYEYARKPDGTRFTCNSLTHLPDTAAHELGHTVGLGDIYDGTRCSGYAMYQTAFDSNGMYRDRQVKPDECKKLQEVHYTTYEQDFDSDEQACSSDPTCDPYAPCSSDPNCTCPLMIDLDRNNFHFAGGPVEFDIDGDGFAERITWTDARQLDAFVAYDRDGNGIVDGGRELFGNATQLIDGSLAPNGYEALAEFDQVALGGNEDGRIDAEDAIYSLLLLWVDTNENGTSEAGELLPIDAAGVVAIDLSYFYLPRVDRYGNEYRFNGRAWILDRGRLRKAWTTDVFFRLY